MSARPKVSVIMPSFNAAQTICVAVESVLGQTFQNWELLVINDGSTDNTLDVMAQFNDRRISLITQVNQGVAAARNAGLKQASGEYIAFLDSDDLWLPAKLEKQVSLLAQSGDCLGLVYTKHRGFTEDPSRSFSMDVDASIGYDNDLHRLLIMDYVPTLTVMMRASLISEIGYFREDLRGTEDWDYWIRAVKFSGISRVNEELALYRISQNSLSRNKDRHSIEELKVLDQHLSAESNIPGEVCHMARAFWCVKKIRHQLHWVGAKNIFSSLKELIQIRPIYFRNYLLLIKWSLIFIFKRFSARLFQFGSRR